MRWHVFCVRPRERMTTTPDRNAAARGQKKKQFPDLVNYEFVPVFMHVHT